MHFLLLPNADGLLYCTRYKDEEMERGRQRERKATNSKEQSQWQNHRRQASSDDSTVQYVFGASLVHVFAKFTAFLASHKAMRKLLNSRAKLRTLGKVIHPQRGVQYSITQMLASPAHQRHGSTDLSTV